MEPRSGPRIGIIGFSAGGHLASTAATHFDDGNPASADPVEGVSCRPDFAILIYPVVKMGETTTHKGSQESLLGSTPTADLIRLFSNEKQVTSRTPPTFLAHALNDTVVPPENSRAFHQAPWTTISRRNTSNSPRGDTDSTGTRAACGTRGRRGRSPGWPISISSPARRKPQGGEMTCAEMPQIFWSSPRLASKIADRARR